eukprot:COSAG04_NODE_9852_length_826_cov_1.406593_3_plen_41_part_01
MLHLDLPPILPSSPTRSPCELGLEDGSGYFPLRQPEEEAPF